MPRREEILASMRDALQILDPEWDISPGSPEYKILEAVAQQGEALSFDSVLSDYHLDVDKKIGFELDLFMSLFGFARIRARRATGYVTFSRGTPALQDYILKQGIQVYIPAVETQSAIYYQTTTSAVLATDQSEVNVPIEAVVAGSEGNASVGEITGIATNNVAGITAVINLEDVTGGRDAESDDDLKARWRRTIFRNISGTEDQFLGIAYNESAFVSRANLIGPIELYDEQLQIVTPEDATVDKPWEGILNGAMTIGANTFTVTDDATYDGYLNFSSHLLSNDPALTETPFYMAFYNDAVGTTVEEVLKVVGRNVSGGGAQVFTTETNALSNHGNGHMVRQVFPSGVTDAKYIYAQGGETVGLNVGRTGQSIGVPNTDYEMIIADNSAVTQGDGNPIPLSVDPSDGYINDANDIIYNIRPFLRITKAGVKKWAFDSVIDFQFEFTPEASRNDPTTITDKVDLFVDGTDNGTVTEQTPFRSDTLDTDYIFNGGTLSGTVVRTNYLRDDGLTHPQSDNFFMPLGKRPVTALPETISIGAKTYRKDENYWLVKDITTLAGSERADDGIEWLNPKDPPVNSVTSGTGYNAAQGPFIAYTNAGTGNLNGWYAYRWTYEQGGVESEPSPVKVAQVSSGDSTPEKNLKGSLGKNTVQLEQANTSASTPVTGANVVRRVYRSKSSATQAAAEAGPFYLLKIIQDDGEDADDVESFIDNTPDDKLRAIQPPIAVPNDGKLTRVRYNYNKLIERIDNNIDLVRLVGMDTMTHERDPIKLKFNLAVVLTPGSTLDGALADIQTNIDAWLRRKTFRNNIQIADVYDTVMNSFFVDNVRLTNSAEGQDDWQVVTHWSTRATPDAATDLFTITFDGQTTGTNSYNESSVSIRESLEALSNINEGNTYATTAIINDTTSTVTVDKKVRGLAALGVVDGATTYFNPEYGVIPVYIQVEDEIMRLRSYVTASPKVWTVTRGRFGSEKYAHGAGTKNVHILGDVATFTETDGTGTGARAGDGSENNPYTTNIIFLKNGWTQTDNVGERYHELLTLRTTGQAGADIEKRANGVGVGIQTVARNDETTVAEYSQDFYLDSDQLPELHSISILLRAQNSF